MANNTQAKHSQELSQLKLMSTKRLQWNLSLVQAQIKIAYEDKNTNALNRLYAMEGGYTIELANRGEQQL